MRLQLEMLSQLAAEEFPLGGLGQLGAVGAVLSLFLWFGWQVYKRERDRADANEKEIARLNQLIQDRYVPSLESASRALAESSEALSISRSRRS